jgi:hypothetical protein
MKALSFTLEINLEKWAVGKSEAAQALLKAFEEAGDQRFPDESLKRPAELAMATIDMDEGSVKLTATCRMAPYESVAKALIERDGGIKAHLSKRGSWTLRIAALALELLGRIDWDSTRQKACERIARSLASASLGSLRTDAEDNIKSMEVHLGIQ